MPASKEMRILVVDDFSTMRRIIKNILRQLGYNNILEADDGSTAWEILNKEKVEFIISDWNMAYKDLQEFLRVLEKQGQLRHIKTPLSPHLEIAEVTDRVSKAVGPALIFDQPAGARFPVATNVFGSFPRMHLALTCDDLDSLGHRIDAVLELEKPEGLIDKLKMLPKLAKMAGIFPKEVTSARCQDVVLTGDDVDLSIMVASEVDRFVDAAREAGLVPEEHIRINRGETEICVEVSQALNAFFTPAQTLWKAQ